jgi:hypothetical protein
LTGRPYAVCSASIMWLWSSASRSTCTHGILALNSLPRAGYSSVTGVPASDPACSVSSREIRYGIELGAPLAYLQALDIERKSPPSPVPPPSQWNSIRTWRSPALDLHSLVDLGGELVVGLLRFVRALIDHRLQPAMVAARFSFRAVSRPKPKSLYTEPGLQYNAKSRDLWARHAGDLGQGRVWRPY